MLRIIARKHDVLRMFAPKQRPPYEEVWHLWTIIIPKRSITGRLLWGTILRRREDDRWIYKKSTASIDATEYRETEYRESARALIRDCRKTASKRRLARPEV